MQNFYNLLELFKNNTNIIYYDDIKNISLYLHKTIYNKYDKQICSICLDEIIYGEIIHKTSCNHTYHHQCIYDYIKSNKYDEYNCPNCRKCIMKEYKTKEEIDKIILDEDWTRDFYL